MFTQFGGPETEQLTDRPVPQAGPGQLAVQVRAAGVNPADWKLRRGVFGRGAVLPAPLGFEVSGAVTAVGTGVHGFAVGDAVLGWPVDGLGGYAEHTLLDAGAAVSKPAEVSFRDAATLPVAGTTAHDLLHQRDLEGGETLLVLGAGGGVGLMAAQLGRVRDLRVIGVASEAKRELVESTGALFVPSGEGAAGRVRELARDGVDLLADLVGGQALRDLASLVKDPSGIVSAADEATATELGGSGRRGDAEALVTITSVVQHGLVDPHVSATYPLDRAAQALALVESGHAAGKVVIEP